MDEKINAVTWVNVFAVLIPSLSALFSAIAAWYAACAKVLSEKSVEQLDTAKTAAEKAAKTGEENTTKIEEVHKVVNSQRDAMLKEIAGLKEIITLMAKGQAEHLLPAAAASSPPGPSTLVFPPTTPAIAEKDIHSAAAIPVVKQEVQEQVVKKQVVEEAVKPKRKRK